MTSQIAATAKNQDDQKMERPFPHPVITYAPRIATAASRLRTARRGRASDATPQRTTPRPQPPSRTQRGRRGPASAALSFRGSDINRRVRHELLTLLRRNPPSRPQPEPTPARDRVQEQRRDWRRSTSTPESRLVVLRPRRTASVTTTDKRPGPGTEQAPSPFANRRIPAHSEASCLSGAAVG
jgi:hypothetical protein